MTGRRERGEGRRPLLARALAFNLVILFVFHGLVSVGLKSGAVNLSDKGTIITALLSATCSVEAGHEAPTPVQGILKKQCCTLCGERLLNAPPASGRTIVTELKAPEASQHSSALFIAHSLARPPTGWASSWSSQAPPSAS
jgi:hypothetical protein